MVCLLKYDGSNGGREWENSNIGQGKNYPLEQAAEAHRRVETE